MSKLEVVKMAALAVAVACGLASMWISGVAWAPVFTAVLVTLWFRAAR